MQVWQKACPKCLGDLREEVAIFDTYIFCTSCRYALTQREKAELVAKPRVAAVAPKPKT